MPGCAALRDPRECRFGSPIEYYPKRKNFAVTLGPLVGDLVNNSNDNALFDIGDGNPSNLTKAHLQMLLGDTSLNGAIDGGETYRATRDYILASPGPDRVYDANPQRIFKSDDIFNIVP